ncbi:UbiD family decarboxylase, partial [Candidatus Poribacteria bacterium]|nr:UbiD family decarboxylase [Candidatus Poribacteria bacterium]
IHYQIHRGIGIHHAKAIKKNQPLKVCIFVGGPPAHTLAAVMPLPEDLSEIVFAGMMANRNVRYTRWNEYPILADADFCLVGTIDPQKTKPEGPFVDHLGYYSLTHEFPYMKVEKVFHRPNAIWPFTVVGRPPQEDSTFGHLIHEITKPMVPVEIPGVKELNAVDEAGVHPLLLAIGSERYVPYRQRLPMEILTQANAILGFNQCSLAKYLFIVAQEDNPDLSTQCTQSFFIHLLERVDLSRDLHFQTQTTIDTLDYSTPELNLGSKVVVAAAGSKIRDLATEIPQQLASPFNHSKIVIPGICAVEGPRFTKNYEIAKGQVESLCASIEPHRWSGIPLVVLVDDIEFCVDDWSNFLWLTFTRSNPATDIYGASSFVIDKHWGTKGPLVIDARFKPHNAPPLIESESVNQRVDQIVENHPELNQMFN